MITNKVYLIRLDFNYITRLTSAFSFLFFFSTSWIHQISIAPAIKKRTLSILRHFVIKCLTSIAPFVCSCYTQKRFIYCSGKTLNCFPVIVGGNHPALMSSVERSLYATFTVKSKMCLHLYTQDHLFHWNSIIEKEVVYLLSRLCLRQPEISAAVAFSVDTMKYQDQFGLTITSSFPKCFTVVR